MKRLLCSTLLVAAAALAGCNQSDHNLSATEPYDPQANVANSAAQVKLPPAITAQKSYRCKDNSVVYVDWYADGSARVKKDRTEPGTEVPAPAEGAKPALGGDAKSASITYNGQSCKA
jgi:hypothetical protein